MLRNSVATPLCRRYVRKAPLLLTLWNGGATMSTGVSLAKNSAVNSQAKIFGKLFGDRVAGSKKRRYPMHEARPNNVQQVDYFNATKLGKPGKKQGKNTTRRMTVLNKLFMKHITDLLATSASCEAIQGRGLQVTHVKISPDFAFVNVFWLGSGTNVADLELEKQLQRCSGLLRHDLSQLSLMGQVPRINFVRNRALSNVTEIETLLRGMDFGDDYEGADITDEVRRDFHWKPLESETVKHISAAEFEKPNDIDLRLPEMRQDVFGLDHRNIMFNILTKMRKSKMAWEMHEQGHSMDLRQPALKGTENSEGGFSGFQAINQKFAEAAAAEKKFDKFLADRKERKNTPERKKFRPSDQMLEMAAADAFLEEWPRQTNEDNDYIYEDENENKL